MRKRPRTVSMWFALATLLCIEAITIFTGVFFIYRHRAEMLQRATVDATLRVKDEIYDHLRPQDLQPPYPSDIEKKLERFESDLRRFSSFFRVKIYSHEGTILWSDEKNLIGRRFTHDALQKALRGETISEVKSPRETEHEYERGYRQFMEIYIPVSVEPGGNVVAVVEAYSDVSNLMNEMRKGQLATVGIALASGGLIFLIPLYIMGRANRVQEILERETRRAREQLVRSEKLASMGRLTAGVSHEILNPLFGITTSLQTLINDPDTPSEITSDLRDMQEQANRIAKITQDLNYFARHRLPERRSVDLNETVKRTLSLVKHELRLQNIAVELDLPEGMPPIFADQDQLQQVILNLLTNARDAMPDGGRLVLSTDTVQTDGQVFVELQVEDTGPGIAPEHMGKIFEPFFTTKPEGKGTGMGLSICHGIIKSHGGAIWAENVPEGGAVFVIQLGIEDKGDEKNLNC